MPFAQPGFLKMLRPTRSSAAYRYPLRPTGFWQHYLLGYDAFGNMTSAQVCASSAEREGHTAPVTLASYTYEGNVNNGRLATMTYGNGDSVSYTYDAFDRQRTAAYNDGTTYHYDYSGDNDLTRQYATDGDGKVTEQYSYQYDSLGRLIHSRQSTANGALIQSTQHMYDAANRMTSQTWQFGTGLYRQQYSYTGVKADGTADSSVDGTISAITTTIPNQLDVTSKYEYNDLRQLEKKTVTVPNQNRGTTTVYTRSYTYAVIAEDDGCNRMGTRLASTGYTFGSSSRSFDYTYDAAGNIQTVTTGGTNVPAAAASKTYTYDAQGQLVSEKNGSGTPFGYAYDTAGNIRNITKDGTVTKSFGYTNPSWPDLLTSVTVGGTTKDILYEGQTQTSGVPSSGNPVTYYNGKDYSFTWTKGRQLASATVDGKQVSYTYDMSGVRTSKTVNGTTYNYTTLSGKVMRQQWDGKTLEFVYDDGNQPFAMIYNDGSTSTLYYYVLNAQGDVMALLNANGKLAASYDYDAWGNCTVYDSSAKVLTDPTSIANLNPLRYRGYYYDAETGFYYLQSRYYDPAICRFINADAYATTNAGSFLSCNMFAYCGNNPVNRADQSGTFWKEIGSFFNKVGTAIAGFAKATFGAGSSLSATITKTEVEYLPDPLPITVKLGTKTTQTISKHGNSSKPISVYAKGNAEHPIKSSSAGIKINIAKFTLDISMGLDNIGISGSLSNGNTTNSFGLKANLSELKVGFEGSTAVKWDNNTETTYTNVSVSGWAIAAAYVFITTGQSMPSPLYAYEY